MPILIVGLVLFLGLHSVRIFAEAWRNRQIAKLGEGKWKGLYSVASIIAFVLIVWGYGLARQQPVLLWQSPIWTRHLAGLLTLISFILLVAAYVPRNHLRSKLHHPMLLGVKLWAFAHLLANGTLADLLLFGSFLVWAAACFRSARKRDRVQGVVYAEGSLAGDAATFVVGAAAWGVFAFWAHQRLIGVAPFG